MSDTHTSTPAMSGYKRLCMVFCLQAMALGLWSVNISAVLKAYGYEAIISFVFACNAIAAFLSPLVVGAFADQRYAPEKVLRFLGLGAAVCLMLLFYAIQEHWTWQGVLVLALVHSIFSVPTFGLTTSIVLSRLPKPEKQFGRVRACATFGWMLGGLVVSLLLHADKSVVAGYAAAVVWLITVAYSFTLPPTQNFTARKFRTYKEMLGLDALSLLKDKNHRIVFVTAAMMNLVLAAFYPYTVLHLDDVGVKGPTAVMSLGQITELITMLVLSTLIGRHSFKTLFITGIGFAILRYALFVVGTPWFLISGIFLHGLCFTLFYITAQIYLEKKVASDMRARAQALLTFMMSGLGNLSGYLICGQWKKYTHQFSVMEWPYFWGGLLAVTIGVMVFFCKNYSDKYRQA